MEFEWTSRLDPATLIIAIFAVAAFGWNVFIYFQQGPKIIVDLNKGNVDKKLGFFEYGKIFSIVTIINKGSPTTLDNLYLANIDGEKYIPTLYLHYRLTPEEPDFPMKIQEGDQIKLLLLHEENLFNFVKNSKSAINIKFSHSNKPIVKKLKKDQFTDGSGSKLVPGRVNLDVSKIA